MNTKDYVIQKESQLERIENIREYNDFKANVDDFRSNADVDYSRVLYSSACRRLQGKMQLFIPKHNVFYRNRLTHSLEVSQIAKSLAKRLGLKDIITVQTCSLAHDLGNPPFGHAGELFLSECSQSYRYEGNAQTYRILTHLEERHYAFNGLNLTLRTLLGIVKYLDKMSNGNKKFLYDSDYDCVMTILNKYNVDFRTIDCEIMDIADEIAYAAHDLEDALKLKYFTIGELLYEFEQSAYKNSYDTFASIVKIARDFARKSKAYHTSEEYSILFRKEITSQIVSMLVKDIDVIESGKGGYCLGYSNFKELSKGLKKLTFEAIKRNPEIKEYELLGKHILSSLFKVYMDEEYNKELTILPAEYRDVPNWERTVIDYIGGMMDSYAISQYEKYFGKLGDSGIYKNNR